MVVVVLVMNKDLCLNISIFVVLAFLVFLRYDEYRNGVLLRQLRAYLRDGPGQSRDVA